MIQDFCNFWVYNIVFYFQFGKLPSFRHSIVQLLQSEMVPFPLSLRQLLHQPPISLLSAHCFQSSGGRTLPGSFQAPCTSSRGDLWVLRPWLSAATVAAAIVLPSFFLSLTSLFLNQFFQISHLSSRSSHPCYILLIFVFLNLCFLQIFFSFFFPHTFQTFIITNTINIFQFHLYPLPTARPFCQRGVLMLAPICLGQCRSQTLISQTYCFSLSLLPLFSTIPLLVPSITLPYTIKTVCPTPFKTHKSSNTVLQLLQTSSSWSDN